MTTELQFGNDSTIAIYTHKCALVMRMVDVAIRRQPNGWDTIVTTHGLNLTKEDAEKHIARFDSGVVHVGGGWYEVILDSKAQTALGLNTDNFGDVGFTFNWVRTYLDTKRSVCAKTAQESFSRLASVLNGGAL